MARDLKKPAARQRADFRTAEACEQFDAPLSVAPAGSRGADQHQLRGMRWMPGGVSQRHHAAERGPKNDRPDDTQHLAKRTHIVAPLREIPAFARTILASAVAAMIQIDDLNDVSQTRVGGPVDRVIRAGPAMKHQQGRLLPHHRTVRYQLCAFDIEEEPNSIDENMHGPASLIDQRGAPAFVGLDIRTKPYRPRPGSITDASHIFGVLPLNVVRFDLINVVVRPQCPPGFIKSSALSRRSRYWRCARRPRRNPMTRKCAYNSSRITCGSSPGRMRSCSTATGNSKTA